MGHEDARPRPARDSVAEHVLLHKPRQRGAMVDVEVRNKHQINHLGVDKIRVGERVRAAAARVQSAVQLV